MYFLSYDFEAAAATVVDDVVVVVVVVELVEVGAADVAVWADEDVEGAVDRFSELEELGRLCALSALLSVL